MFGIGYQCVLVVEEYTLIVQQCVLVGDEATF